MENLKMFDDKDLIEEKNEIAIARLRKGDRVPVHEIEAAFGVTRDTDDYKLAALQLKSAVEQEFLRRDPPERAAMRILKDVGLVILTDDEAVNHNIKTVKHGIRKVRRSHRRQQSVDRAQVAPENLPRLDRALDVVGRIISVIGQEIRRQPEVVPRKRQTPK